MSVLPNGAWTQETADANHQHSPKLAQWLINYLPKNTPVLDLGCGLGFYVHHLNEAGFVALGIDGVVLDTPFESANIFKYDLTQALIHEKGAGCFTVISLEVGEHLPPEAQENFMKTLTINCQKHLILSWAEIGQPGVGHVNCRSQQDVIADVESRGFTLNKAATADARQHIDDNCYWFRRTLLVFECVK